MGPDGICGLPAVPKKSDLKLVVESLLTSSVTRRPSRQVRSGLTDRQIQPFDLP